ncbi:ParB N-terminal domain-containing protein [Tropicimonas sp. IMCC34043]|uniref:ParB/RepB/Spo0J family partition protein n=1 Tax=Tropicimonas sp. IMCC34043 TaxID=2248760 RepID=UPI000E27DC82|nr:ParB N-terminal domain-containing protein [Tropicimonas sp. IMCC34043]
MSRRRRVFDIDLPEAEEVPAAAETAEADARRRGPMAAAVRETADAVRDRAGQEAAIRAENDRLAHEHVRLKRAGLITDLVPLEAIATQKLARDRSPRGTLDLEDLKLSIAEVGLSNPIQVEQVGEASYELVQGLRRLSAFRALLEETGDAERWGKIPAVVRPLGDDLPELYRRMVDENLVRQDISFWEMARLASDYAHDPATPENDAEAAVLTLYRSANKQKRSYIRGFLVLVERLGASVEYPERIPRALGLALRKRLEEVPGIEVQIGAALADLGADRSAEAELAVLRAMADLDTRPADPGQGAPRPRGGAVERPARTTFRLDRACGPARCVASKGRLEVHLDTDFSAKDRRRLEEALAAFLDELGE